MREAVKNLEIHMRPSALGDGTQVLVLRNATPTTADFNLRCFTRNDAAQKEFFVSVPPRAEKRIGFVQGWDGNFTSGQRVEAWHDGELLWKYVVR